jgi:hypothetical protein
MRRSIVPVILLVVLASLSACSSGVFGVDINNMTDRIVRIELLQLRKNGEMTVYSTQTLGPGGEFKHKVDSEERRPGMRVRMMYADQRIEDANWVQLNLPGTRDRVYDLVTVGNRLSAKEQTKARKMRNPD